MSQYVSTLSSTHPQKIPLISGILYPDVQLHNTEAWGTANVDKYKEQIKSSTPIFSV